MHPNLSIRDLDRSDFEDVLSWRADVTTRQMSRYQGSITAEGFKPIFDSYLILSKSFIITLDDVKIAIIILTPIQDKNNTWEIGINLNPEMRGKGLSKPILRKLLDSLDTKIYKNIIATVKRLNTASIKLFTGVGFKEVPSIEPGYLHFNYQPIERCTS